MRRNPDAEYEPEVEAEQQIERDRRRLEDYDGTDSRDTELAERLKEAKREVDAMPDWMKNQEPPPGTSYADWLAAAGPYKVQVIADSIGTWCGNGLTFSSPDDAERYARELMDRWTAVREWRVIDRAGTVVRGSGSDF